MTDLHKAAQQALECLEQLQGGCTDSGDGTVEAITVWCPEVITALREALAKPAVPEMHDALCPALTGGACTCSQNPMGVDKAWAQFCGGIGRGPNAPYPGMIDAFEAHYGQSFTDKDWRTETGIWAAAWKAALAAKPAVPASFTDEDMKASWLTGFKEAEFQFRGGTEKSGEFPAKTPLSVAPQAAPPKQPSVPPGYALVPIEPTPEMCQSAQKAGFFQSHVPIIWKALLSAAQQPKDKP